MAAVTMQPRTGRIVIVGLGPADAALVTAETRRAIESIANRYSRTDHHRAIEVLGTHESFDSRYEAAEHLADVYVRITEDLVRAAQEYGEVLYAVPGSPAVAEHTVELLTAPEGIAARAGVQVEVLAALSFLDLAWVRLGVDPIATSVRVVDGQRFEEQAAGERGPLLVAQCDSLEVLSTIKLAVDPWPDSDVVVLQRLGAADEAVRHVRWEDLDRDVGPDHLTSLYLPELEAPVGAELVAFAELVARLRRECPWDREQTHQSLTRHLLEESYELLEAIEQLDPDEPTTVDHLEEELGDVLFQVYFHATLAAEEGWFTLADVARGIHDKLVARHPHVFGEVAAATTGEVLANWEQLKRVEKGRTSVLDGVPTTLPGVLLSTKLMKKAAAVGVRYEDLDEALGKLDEELAELRAALASVDRADSRTVGTADAGASDAADDHGAAVAAELGDVLFAACGVGWTAGVDPEAALRAAAQRFKVRVAAVESFAAADGVDPSTADRATLDTLWSRAKQA